MTKKKTKEAEYESFESALKSARSEWEKRLNAIRSDRRREKAPLVADFPDQAIQRENDETLDALDAQGRKELAAIESALRRIEARSFGICLGCGEEIPTPRLRAYPTAERCVDCEEAVSA
jgi:RNA polymerase-binding protein DksA